MAKKSKVGRRSRAQKQQDERLFLKLLENVSKQKEQKTVKKIGSPNRRTSKSPNPKGKKPTKKSDVSKSDKTRRRVTSDRGRKTSKPATKGIINKRVEPGSLRAEPTKRGAKRIDFSFGKIRSVDKKIAAFNQQSDDAIKKELRKRGGKPPRGIIVIVSDKEGNEKAFVSPLDFVVNKENVKNFIGEKLEEMKLNFMAWKGMKKADKEFAKEMKEQGYGDYNPDTIQNITIKFIV